MVICGLKEEGTQRPVAIKQHDYIGIMEPGTIVFLVSFSLVNVAIVIAAIGGYLWSKRRNKAPKKP